MKRAGPDGSRVALAYPDNAYPDNAYPDSAYPGSETCA